MGSNSTRSCRARPSECDATDLHPPRQLNTGRFLPPNQRALPDSPSAVRSHPVAIREPPLTGPGRRPEPRRTSYKWRSRARSRPSASASTAGRIYCAVSVSVFPSHRRRRREVKVRSRAARLCPSYSGGPATGTMPLVILLYSARD